MAKDDIKKFEFNKGESGNPNGRPKGSKNRSTIAKYWLQAIEKAENPINKELEALSQEDLMTLSLIKKAREGDVNAYNALMNSGYGAPIQQIESNTNVTNIPVVSWLEKKQIDFDTDKFDI